MKLTKIVAVNVAVLLALLVVFDLAGYLLLPVDWNFSGYRSEASSRTDVAGLFYPRYYFEQRATRGFDIRPAAHGVSVTNNFYFPIEANELGCRDRKFSFNAERPLIYAAGDSQTWGIVSTDARWTNLLENKSGIPVLNCGVPGTAQKHQREKYREVTSALKRQPDLVLVVYISNDVAEDAGFPAYTVIDGFLTMNNASREELKVRVDKGIERLRNPRLVDRIKGVLKRYSLSVQCINALWKRATDYLTAPPIDTTYDYSGPRADANKQAIKDFAQDACSSGTRFALLIPPDAAHLMFPDYFRGLDDFLRANGIFAVDFHRRASKQGLGYADFAQFNDPHFSNVGNAHFADELYSEMKKDGDSFGSCNNPDRGD